MLRRTRAIVVGLLVVGLPPVMLAGAWSMAGASALEDDLIYYLPQRAFFGAAVRGGELPLWNPHVALGYASAADPQSGTWYPGTYLFALFHAGFAYPLTICLHFALAGWGMYRFLRGLHRHWAAALLGAVAFEFCGFLVAHRAHLTMHHAAAWVPLILWRWDRYARAPHPRRFAVAVFCMAAQLLVQHIQVSIITGALVAAYVACVGWPRRRRVGPGFVVGMGLTAGIAAVQLIPTAMLLRHTTRSLPLYERFVENSFEWSSLALWVFPFLYGSRTPNFYEHAWWGRSHLCEQAAYASLPVLFLAIAALALWKRNGQVRFWSLAGLACFALALGEHNPITPLLFHVPGLDVLRVPARWLLGVNVALVMLAAAGLDVLLVRRDATDLMKRALSHVVRYAMPGVLIASVALMAWARWRFRDDHSAYGEAVATSLNVGNPAILIPIALMVVTGILLARLCRAKAGVRVHDRSCAGWHGQTPREQRCQGGRPNSRRLPVGQARRARASVAAEAVARPGDRPARRLPMPPEKAQERSYTPGTPAADGATTDGSKTENEPVPLYRGEKTVTVPHFAFLLVALTVADLASFAAFNDIERGTYTQTAMRAQPLAEWLKTHTDDQHGHRLWIPRERADYRRPLEVAWPMTNLLFGVDTLQAYTPLVRTERRHLLGFKPWGASETALTLLRNPGLLRALSVRWVAGRSPEERALLASAGGPDDATAWASIGISTVNADVEPGPGVIWPVSIEAPGVYGVAFTATPADTAEAGRWFVVLESATGERVVPELVFEPVDLPADGRRMRCYFRCEKAMGAARVRVYTYRGRPLRVSAAVFGRAAALDEPTAACARRWEGPDGVVVHEVTESRPRAYLVEEVVPAASAAEALSWLTADDVANGLPSRAIVEGYPEGARPFLQAGGMGKRRGNSATQGAEPSSRRLPVGQARRARARASVAMEAVPVRKIGRTTLAHATREGARTVVHPYPNAGREMGIGRVRVVGNALNQVDFDVEINDSDRGFLVVANTFDTGWSATVDGEAVPVYRTNRVIQGVVVPGGSHHVTFRYWPPGLTAGIVVSLLSVAAAVTALRARFRTGVSASDRAGGSPTGSPLK